MDRYDHETHPDGKEDVDLELYNSSPKKYQKSPIEACLYSEEKMYPEHWFLRSHAEQVLISPGTGQYLLEMQHPPDILTTRVCVELGLVPASNPGLEANIIVEAPSIRLCNLEVEPREGLDTTASEMIPSPTNSTNIPAPILRRTTKEMESATNDKVEVTELTAQRNQPQAKTHISELSDDDNLEGMLDRISHDLDYLLNRTIHELPEIPEIQITPAAISLHSRKTSKLPASSVRGQIKEEDELEQEEEDDKQDMKASDTNVGIAKTVC